MKFQSEKENNMSSSRNRLFGLAIRIQNPESAQILDPESKSAIEIADLDC